MEELVKQRAEKSIDEESAHYMQEVNSDGSPKHIQPETTQTSTSNVMAATTEQTVREYLKKENVQKNLRIWAQQFDDRFHSNWFSIAQVIKKTQLKDPNQAQHILDLSILLGLAHREYRQGVMKYKICLEVEQKIKFLRQQQDEYREHIELLEKEITNLEAGQVADVTI